MGKYKRFGRNTIYVLLGNISAKGIGFVMLPLYTRWLSVEDYGISDIITVYVTLLLGIVSCCIAEAIFIFPKNKSKDVQKRYLSSALAFLSIISLIVLFVFLFIKLCSISWNVESSFTKYIWYIYALLLSQILQSISQQFTRSIDKMAIYSITGIVVAISTAIFAFIFIPGRGVEGYIISLIIAHYCGSLFAIVASKSYRYISVKSISLVSCKEMLMYSIPLIPNGIMWWMVNAINRPIMEHYVGFHDIGIYAVANKFPSMLTVLLNVFVHSWQISVLEEFGKPSYSVFYNKLLRLFVILSSMLLLVMTLFSKQLVFLFTTSDYYEAWLYIPILTLGVVFSNLGGFAGGNFSAVKQSKYYFFSSMWAALSALLFNTILIPVWGLIGAVTSTLISFFVLAVSRFVYSSRFVKANHILNYVIILLLNIILYLMMLLNINYCLCVLYATFVVFIYLIWQKDEIKKIKEYVVKKYSK